MMDGEKAVVAVIKEIGNLSLPSYEGIFFKYPDKPKGYKGEYISVNHLPFVYDTELENGIVNVNVHVPRLNDGRIDTARLYALWTPIMEHFKASGDEDSYGRYLDGAYFSFYSHSQPTPDDDNTYYVNIQLKVTFNNLN